MAHAIGAFDAKTHLSSLLDRVEAGEEFIITRRGKPVARLGVSDNKPKSTDALLQILKESQIPVRATNDEILSWINEGRR
jgi:prevent-host-death family protein